jgi:hypothetical protein
MEENQINEVLGKHNTLKETDDFEQLPPVEKVKVILLSSMKKLEILDNYVREFIDDEDKANHKNMDIIFGALMDDIIEVVTELN